MTAHGVFRGFESFISQAEVLCDMFVPRKPETKDPCYYSPEWDPLTKITFFLSDRSAELSGRVILVCRFAEWTSVDPKMRRAAKKHGGATLVQMNSKVKVAGRHNRQTFHFILRRRQNCQAGRETPS